MKPQTKISEAEWLICQILWQQAPATAEEVVNSLLNKILWKPKTVKTLLNRLLRKGVLGYHKAGRQYRYYPILTQEECIQAETESFIQRVFGGAVQPTLAAFLKHKKLSPKEIEELKRILDQQGGK